MPFSVILVCRERKVGLLYRISLFFFAFTMLGWYRVSSCAACRHLRKVSLSQSCTVSLTVAFPELCALAHSGALGIIVAAASHRPYAIRTSFHITTVGAIVSAE